MEFQPGQALMKLGENGIGSVSSLVFGGGFAVRVPVGSWLMLEPNVLVGKHTMKIAGGPLPVNLDSREKSNQPFYQPGITIRTGPFQTGSFALSGFFDASLMTPIDFVLEGTDTGDKTILKTSLFNMRFGVGFHF